jgi:hypothetical protein
MRSQLMAATGLAAFATFAADKGPGVAPAASPTAAAVAAPRVAPEITAVSNAVPIPDFASLTGRGSNSQYPFDSLTEVGASFGVKNKTKDQVRVSVSGQNKKHATTTLGADNKPVTTHSKFYVSAEVDPKTDPDGATVRVWRKQ